MNTGLPSSPANPLPSADAIVLCRAVTGLATVRALARQGVRVHAFLFDRRDPLWSSRYGGKIDVSDCVLDDARLIERLETFARTLGGRPVVIPTSDALALLLAGQRARLETCCRLWSTDPTVLRAIVDKRSLYERAQAQDVPTIPGVAEASLTEVAQWSTLHAGPYFLKPLYEAIGQSSVRGKNHVVATREELLAFVAERGLRNALVQRCLAGGDGEIFDTYGLCDRAGRVVVMASHRRLRQYPPDTGITSFGAIPSGLADDEVLFAPTERLLAGWGYHGIFGIEWLRDRETGRFYLIDFNARPFSSIGHLSDGGLNLPWLAWRELQDEALDDVSPRPALAPTLWIDALRDLASWRRAGRGRLRDWPAQWRAADLHAYWSADDAGPAWRQARDAAGVIARWMGRRVIGVLPFGRDRAERTPARRQEDLRPPIVPAE